MPDTATAVLEPLVAPFPSWPLSPLPQHLAAPDAVSAQLWAPPEEKLALCEQKKPLGVPVFLQALLEIQVCVFNAHWSLIEHGEVYAVPVGFCSFALSRISIVSGLGHIFVFNWFCLLGFVRLRSPDIEGVLCPVM